MHKLIITAIAMLISLANTAQTSIKIGENIIPIIGAKVAEVIIYPSLRENETRTKETTYCYNKGYIVLSQITYAENNENTVSIYKYATEAKLITKLSTLKSDRYKAGVVYNVTISCTKANYNEMTYFDTHSTTPDLLTDQTAIVSFTTKAKAEAFAKGLKIK